MNPSVRERIMLELVSRLEAMDTPTYSGAWAYVTRSPLERAQALMGNAVGVYDIGQSNPFYGVGYIQWELRVGFEFWYQLQLGEEASTGLNKLLTDLQLLLLSDPNLIETATGTKLSINVQLSEDNFDIDGPNDNFVSGFLVAEIIYRYSATDPTVLI